MTFPMTIVDTIFKALAPAIPERVIAGHHADLIVGLINGHQPKTGKFFIYLGGLIGGGWGAKLTEDGVSATVAINDGDTHNGPTEQVEAKYPLLVERYALRQDSGGAGRQRGGLGTEQVVRALHDIRFNAQIDRVRCRPWGIDRGLSGAGNEVLIKRAGQEAERFPTGKVLAYQLRRDDAYILRSGGGGGFGTPLDRPVAVVERDVREGYVSIEAAARDYGIVMDPQGARADAAASQALRAKMRSAGLPKDTPIVPLDPKELEVAQNQSGSIAPFPNRCC
jgi:N-methylhydantoinase B